jgi:hypothetical protein
MDVFAARNRNMLFIYFLFALNIFLCAAQEDAVTEELGGLVPLAVNLSGNLMLIPRDVYVGDTAVLRYTFRDENNALPSLPQRTPFLPDAIPFNKNELTVTEAFLSRDGSVYTLELTFTPWKTGTLVIPSFEFESTVEIIIPPFVIASLSESLGETKLRPLVPPKIIPGTTLTLIAVFVSVPAAVVLVIMIMRNKKIAAFMASLRVSRGARIAFKKIKKLRKRLASMSHADLAREIETLLRDYLTEHFSLPFFSYTAREVERALEVLPDGNAFANDTGSLFMRCDYIRFARETGVVFSFEEHKVMLDDIQRMIHELESAVVSPLTTGQSSAPLKSKGA